MQNNHNLGQIPDPRKRAPQDPRRRPANQSMSLRERPAARRPEEAQRGPRQPEPPRRSPRNSWFIAILMVIATVGLCFFLATFILQSANDLFGLNQDDKQIEVVVPQDSTMASVSALLYDKGIVNQPFTFRLYSGLKIKDEAKELKPGSYIFNSNFSYDQIIAALKTGNTKKEEVRVTFIEGMTIYEIAQKLEENKVCKARDFLEYTEKGDIDYEFMNQVPINQLRFRRLEGYIFPDTYEFYVGMDVPLVADKFLSNLDKRITEDMRATMREMNLSFDETLILASIIQKEAGDPLEMRMVSSVFLNRLEDSATYPNLQSDVTIHYVDNFIKPFLDMQNQPMYDAYNTYKCEGMPVGAICNPGLDAINAVLDPEESDYYFFVTDDEGTYYYATTAQQHYNNVAKAAQVGGDKVHGTATAND